jgi:hypothetical protein
MHDRKRQDMQDNKKLILIIMPLAIMHILFFIVRKSIDHHCVFKFGLI